LADFDQKLKDDANTFVLKEYFTSNAKQIYKAEVNAFRRLGPASSIIAFRGSFIRGDSFNVLLEYADKGSLEDYFRTVQPPADGEQIIQFWEALSEIVGALMKIHGVKPDDTGQGRVFQG
jgi:serine/threonine protein kinase